MGLKISDKSVSASTLCTARFVCTIVVVKNADNTKYTEYIYCLLDNILSTEHSYNIDNRRGRAGTAKELKSHTRSAPFKITSLGSAPGLSK